MSQKIPASLVAVVQVFRHGDRTAIYRYPNDPYGEDVYSPYEMGVLTNKGIQEMFDLGKFTRERYKNFLPSLFPIKNLHVYTTDVLRTIQSAQAYTAGLYPPTKALTWNKNLPWTPIPTYMADEYLFRNDLRPIAPVYAREFKKFMDEHLEQFKNDPRYEIISSNSGVESDYLNLVFLLDTLTIQDSFGLKLPDWTETIYPNKKFHLDCLQCVAKSDVMKRLFAGPQLYETIQHFEKMIKDPTSGPKLFVFSGHDANLAAILDTFNAFERHLPAYASSIFIELVKKNGEHYVNVFYKQEDVVPIKVRGADFDCKFEKFKELLSYYAISKEQFYKECV